LFSGNRRLGLPTAVIAIVALVLAMTGGAIAAKKYVITSTGQIKPNVLNQLKGKQGKTGKTGAQGAAGAAGPAGPAGPAGKEGPAGPEGEPGPAGATGPKGTTGQNGQNGPTGVTGATGNNGTTGATGVTGATGPEGVCSTVTTCTLPVGVTETGTWSMGTYLGPTLEPLEAISNPVWAPISFAIPLAAALPEAKVHYIAVGETPSGDCAGGTAAAPKAASGSLCIYATSETGSGSKFLPGPPQRPDFSAEEPGASKTGSLLKFFVLEKGAAAYGTFAVTG
jgi:hypothetical protein